MSFDKYRNATLDVLNSHYNLNLFSSSNREALADKIASAISGEGLPKDRSPQELNPVIPQAEDGLQNKDNVEKTYNSKKSKPIKDKKGKIINKSVKHTKKRTKRTGGLSNLKNKNK